MGKKQNFLASDETLTSSEETRTTTSSVTGGGIVSNDGLTVTNPTDTAFATTGMLIVMGNPNLPEPPVLETVLTDESLLDSLKLIAGLQDVSRNANETDEWEKQLEEATNTLNNAL